MNLEHKWAPFTPGIEMFPPPLRPKVESPSHRTFALFTCILFSDDGQMPSNILSEGNIIDWNFFLGYEPLLKMEDASEEVEKVATLCWHLLFLPSNKVIV